MIDVWDCIAAVGAALILAGIWCIYWPAALIACGLMLVFVSVLKVR